MSIDGAVDVAAVRARHRIEQVVAAAGVQLRRSGRGYLGCCPFHEDSTASMSVGGVPDRFHCFGCGASGDVIDFTQRRHGVGFREAVQILEGTAPPRHADAAANPPAVARPPSAVTPERGYEINALAWDHFSRPVGHAIATAYLHHRRGIDLAPLENHHGRPMVGHADHGWTTLVDCLRAAGVTDAELLAVDLAQISRRGTPIDTLRDRLIIPITTADGRISGFVGRDIGGDPRSPKYRNPTRTATFDKATALYLPSPPSRPDATVVVVEGTLDALAVSAAALTVGRLGDLVACSTNGTTVSPAQARRVMSLTTGPIVIALDADPAGAAGTDRWLDLLCRHAHRPALVTRLPDAADPAAWLATHGPAGLSAFDPSHTGGVHPHQPGAELARLCLARGGHPIAEAIRTLAPLVQAQPAADAARLIQSAQAEMTRQGWNPHSVFTRALARALTLPSGPEHGLAPHGSAPLWAGPARQLR